MLRRALIVDDNPDIRDLLVILATRAGFKSIAVSNCEEALSILDSATDLIVLDVFCGPKWSSMIDRLRGHGLLNRVLICSGHSAAHAIAKNIGAAGAVTKPFLLEEFTQRINDIADRRRRQTVFYHADRRNRPIVQTETFFNP